MVRAHDQVKLRYSPQQCCALLTGDAPCQDQLQVPHLRPLPLCLQECHCQILVETSKLLASLVLQCMQRLSRAATAQQLPVGMASFKAA